MPQTIRDRARSTVTSRLDPFASRRATALARRRLRGRPMSESIGAAVDWERQSLLLEITRGLRTGTLGDEHRAELAPLVEAYLADVDESASGTTTAAVCTAFENLFQPRSQPVPEPREPIRRAIVDSFQRLYYCVSATTWKDTWYRGIRTYKCPSDMWVYQELIDTLRPSLVIETGTFRGGSALFVADRLETLGHGEVITVDVDVQPDRPEHPRLTYLTGSSVGEEVLTAIRSRLPEDGHVLVILDSDHSRDHVLAELQAYAPMVTTGSYVIVEDTNVNGHPTAPDYGPGPWEAAHDFLAGTDEFVVDARCERYYVTQNPQGFLKRIG